MVPKRNIDEFIFLAIAIGIILIFVFIFIAILYYPGGTKFDSDYPRYSFSENYLSDLGCVYAFNNEYNLISRIFFAFALTIAGIGLIAFYYLMPRMFNSNIKIKKISLSASVIGIFSSLFCIGIAYIPLDTKITIHRTAVYAFGVICLPAHILLAIAIFCDKTYPNFYAWILICYSIFLTTYILLWIIFKFDSPYTQEVTKIVGQKIILFLEAISIITLSFGAQRILRNKRIKKESSDNIETAID